MTFHTVANSAHLGIHSMSVFLYVFGSVVRLNSYALRPLDAWLHVLYDMRCHSLGRRGCFRNLDHSKSRDSGFELSLHMMKISTCVIHVFSKCENSG